MVYFPRFWGGLPFPPSRLVDMSVEMNMGRDPKAHPPTETYKRFYTEPRPEKAGPSSEVQRLIDSGEYPKLSQRECTLTLCT